MLFPTQKQLLHHRDFHRMIFLQITFVMNRKLTSLQTVGIWLHTGKARVKGHYSRNTGVLSSPPHSAVACVRGYTDSLKQNLATSLPCIPLME